MDVVTLLPAATEIVCSLGVTPVATSHECDYPPEVTALPTVTVGRIDGDGSSREIDDRVARAEDGDGLYDVRVDLLAELDPDLVVTQGVCDVCAVDSVLVQRIVAERDLDADVLTTDPHRLGDLFDEIRRIGEVLDRESAARRVVADLQDRVDAVQGRVESVESEPTVAVLDWLDPVMVAGHWIPELVELAGGLYPMAAAGERSRPREWREILEEDPDVLVAAPCGFELEQTRENSGELTDRPEWSDLRAVGADRAYLMDGHHYVNRPGPRLVDTLEHLAGVLHPELESDPPESVVESVTSRAGRRH